MVNQSLLSLPGVSESRRMVFKVGVSVTAAIDYKSFVSRIKEMNQLAIEEKEQEKEKELGIRRVILSLSL